MHRLLIEDSVDQRMLELLGSKAQLFDAYVRHSAIAEAAPGAVDISEVQLELRGSRAQLFDAEVRHGAIAEAAPGAVDISEVQLARTIVAQEQRRLAPVSVSPAR